MTPYTQIGLNIRKTWLLFTIFLVVIIGLGWFLSYYFVNQNILFVAIIFSFFMSFISFWYSDKIVLAISKAKPLKHNDNPGLYHIVENLCITAGLPVPKIYVINEPAPNAFATGRNPKHAVVAVTLGLIEKLDRSEIEGVIAHELSHIGNRDILISTVVVVLVGFIVMFSDFFLRMSFFGGRRRDNREGKGELDAIMIIIGVLGAILSPIIAKLIQLAISRKREFLADASGVMLTRYPDGLASALAKISQDQNSLRAANKATAHLYIASPFKGRQAKGWLVHLFSTHPPIEERIKRLKEINI